MRLPNRLDRLEGMTRVTGCTFCRDWPDPYTSWQKVSDDTALTMLPAAPVCPACGRQSHHVHIVWECWGPEDAR